ncbi:tyrosine-type recombinase/integrase [Acinetobacter genomosp. 15BJ]|uniref:Site-specific integrase n=1 Tax=Acinetobacter genomosp. 15BJ TaxID=106651 RepID=A0ABT8UZ88_9GAMM|nr:site-specific integrase [Acinetobacter genomosp. 15BJ]MDO3658373.1 site-specific integrase [Acinetobacter genomosp. 15BJ]
MKTFDQCFSAHFETYKKSVQKQTGDARLGIFLNHISPVIGRLNMDEIRVQQLRPIFDKLEHQGKTKTLHKTHEIISQIFDYGIVIEECCEVNPAHPIKRFLAKHVEVNHPFLDESQIPKLFTQIRSKGRLSVQAKVALLLITYTAVRCNEAVKAKWQEFDFESRLWSIPAARMKMRNDHLVPLSKPVIDLLKSWKLKSKNSKYVFPKLNISNKHDYMQSWCLSRAISHTEFYKRQTVHGLRQRFSTSCYESNLWRDAAIELCLAHKIGGVVGVYNKAKYLEERRKIMQWYADNVQIWTKGFIADSELSA